MGETSDIQPDRPELHSQSSSPVLFRKSPLPSRMKPVLALLLTVLSVSLAEGRMKPDIEELEMQAFEQCESDGEEGLTWDEVEECEAIFGPMLTDQGIVLPTEEDFQASDLNKDGILLLREWKEWVDMDMAMVDGE